MTEENLYPDFPNEPLIKPQPRKQGWCRSTFNCLCCCCVKDKVTLNVGRAQQEILG
jgi:hypothetical protein